MTIWLNNPFPAKDSPLGTKSIEDFMDFYVSEESGTGVWWRMDIYVEDLVEFVSVEDTACKQSCKSNSCSNNAVV